MGHGGLYSYRLSGTFVKPFPQLAQIQQTVVAARLYTAAQSDVHEPLVRIIMLYPGEA